jgi:aminomethyltransferase
MTTTLRETPLAPIHQALGARMAPFSGWLMPIQYEGIVAEHLWTRNSAGLFDLSHMGRLLVRGADAVALIQEATTNDVERLTVGKAHYTLICNEDGGVAEDLLVYRLPDGWRLVVNASNREMVVALLDSLKARRGYAVDVHDETFALAMLALQGPQSAEVLVPLVGPGLTALPYYAGEDGAISLPSSPPIPAFIARTGYTGEDGVELMIPAERAADLWNALSADERVKPIGLGARDTLRLEAGMALYGHELTPEVNPYEAALGRVVKLDKGRFRGRDALAELRQQGPVRKLVGLTFATGAVPRGGFPVRRDDEEVGTVASGTFSPSLRRPIATALVRTDAATVGTELQVRIREADAPATVVSLPFVPHHTKS